MFNQFAAAIAASVVFCETQKTDEPRCAFEPVEAVELTAGHIATIERLAREARAPRRYIDEGDADEWRIAGPDEPGDCEDRVLWVARELRRAHPELRNAYRFVAVQMFYAVPKNAAVTQMHLVLVVEGAGRRIVVDPRHAQVQDWRRYARARRLLTGMAGRWEPYR